MTNIKRIAVDIERLREILHYDAGTGIFTWVKPTSFRVKVGDQAGVSCGGYVLIGIDGVQYMAHRLAIYYVTGRDPVLEVDHRNQARSDNRYLNLREVTHKMNIENQRAAHKRNSTGLLGASHCSKTGRYRAMISVGGKTIHLGRFDTPEQAHKAYVEAKRKKHKGNTL